MLWLLPIALSATLLAPTAAAPHDSPLVSPYRRVRALQPRMTALLAEGMQRSRTFARMVRDLDRGDVIVYVQAVHDLPSHLAGRMLLMPNGGAQRFVRIQVRAEGSDEQIIETVGHELRHALELVEHATVRDTAAMSQLYKKIGKAVPGVDSYDTDAAQNAGRLVRSELGG
jgi:hypothetical protein